MCTYRGGGRVNGGTKLERMLCTCQPGLFAIPKKLLLMTRASFLVLFLAGVAVYPLSHGIGPWGVPELPWSWDQGCTWGMSPAESSGGVQTGYICLVFVLVGIRM